MAISPRTLLSPRINLGAALETTPGGAPGSGTGQNPVLTIANQAWPAYNFRWRELTKLTPRPMSDKDGFLPSTHDVLLAELAFQIELAGGSAASAMTETFLPMLGLGQLGAETPTWTSLTVATDFTAIPVSTNTLTMVTDQTDVITVGMSLQFVIGGVTYYDKVASISATSLSTFGAKFSGTLTSLSWGGTVFFQTRQLPSDPSAEVTTGTLQFFEDGTLRTVYGCMANGIFHFLPDDRILIDVTATGKMIAETDADQPRPALTSPASILYYRSGPPHAGGTVVPALSFMPAGGTLWLPVHAGLELDLGNTIVVRKDANALDGSGVQYCHIGPRATKATLTVERNQAAFKDLIGEWLAGTQSFIAGHGDDRSSAPTPHTVDFSAGQVEWSEPEDVAQDGKAMRKLGVKFNSPDLAFVFA